MSSSTSVGILGDVKKLVDNFKRQLTPLAVQMVEQSPSLLYTLLYQEIIVKDWREVVPFVEKFYTHFTKESLPELESIVSFFSTPEERISNELTGEYSAGRYIIPTRTIKIAPLKGFARTSVTLFHELMHRVYDGEERLILAPYLKKDDVSLSEEERKYATKEYFRLLFLHECVATAGSTFFEKTFFPKLDIDELSGWTPSNKTDALGEFFLPKKNWLKNNTF